MEVIKDNHIKRQFRGLFKSEYDKLPATNESWELTKDKT